MSNLVGKFLRFTWLALAVTALCSQAQARLLLYIDTSKTVEIEVIMLDNKDAGYQIKSEDTNDTNLVDKYVTFSDNDDAIGRISFDPLKVSDFNSLLGAGLTMNPNFTAYSTSIPGPAPTGGEQLNVYANIIKTSGASATFVIAATRTLEFAAQGWFYDHSTTGTAKTASNTAVSNQALINNLEARGGISTTPQDFELTPGLFNGGTVNTTDAGEGLYAVQPGTVGLNSSVIGSLTMTLKFNGTLNSGDNVIYEAVIFATTPEPISIATWGLVGGGMWLTARRHRRRL